ncbi:response regulator transcription factor [Rhodococcus sp. X156]|uniref:response regulator transcription factor n=1 Tax=Rhodococcus sp. X156 TaxID=2499145 RepID=UPI0019D0DD76|nr:response regulator transcription factor [Rhodococcus sp. X156]
MSGAVRTVLIADDDPDIRRLIELAVQRAGFTVLASVGDGQAALDAAAVQLPHLAILDVSMPQVTGLQVCAALRAEHGDALRVLILSANAEVSAVQAGLAAGADTYLPKPFALRELRAKLGELLADPVC